MSSIQLITPVTPEEKVRRRTLRKAFAVKQEGIIPPAKKAPRPVRVWATKKHPKTLAL
jgi:hypothetical protein